MSTIKEVRAQACEALTTITKRMAGSRLGKSTMREMDADILALRGAGHALEAMLDATEPAEDEREALVMTRKLVHEVLEQSRTLPLDVQSAQVMLVLLDAGYSKGPRPITDEMVDAADFAIMPYWGERYPSGSLTTEIARAALEAAEEARR